MLKYATHAAALAFVLLFASRTSLAQNSGADLYKSKCAACHGTDGLASTPMGPALHVISYKNPAVLKMKDADLIAIIKGGKNNMPKFDGKLTDAQIKELVKYIHTLQK